MKKNKQTRLHNPPCVRGNCFAAVLSSLLELESAEDVIQIQEHYEKDWVHILDEWLISRGYGLEKISGHLDTKEYYMVTGKTDTGVMHVCIYKNGKMVWDPNPSKKGIVTEEYFEVLRPLPTSVE